MIFSRTFFRPAMDDISNEEMIRWKEKNICKTSSVIFSSLLYLSHSLACFVCFDSINEGTRREKYTLFIALIHRHNRATKSYYPKYIFYVDTFPSSLERLTHSLQTKLFNIRSHIFTQMGKNQRNSNVMTHDSQPLSFHISHTFASLSMWYLKISPISCL